MNRDIEVIQAKIQEASGFVDRLLDEVGRVIVGQKTMVERLLVGLLSDGHVLMEGVPGLAKTLTVRTLADAIQTSFQRIQFTPDLLPADLIGTLIYDPQKTEFKTKKGPIFANVILADEINRSPAKVQSALLEAMQEHTVTIGENTFPLPSPFLVLATQNPIDQEGTYPLPEAQVDRFMLKLSVGYPDRDEELEIMRRMGTGPDAPGVSRRDPRGNPAGAPGGRDDLHGQPGRALYRRACFCNSRTHAVWPAGAGPAHRVRRIAQGDDLPREDRPRTCIPAAPRLCDAGGRALGGDGRAAPPHHPDV